jgi:hypothetical protein
MRREYRFLQALHAADIFPLGFFFFDFFFEFCSFTFAALSFADLSNGSFFLAGMMRFSD